jgi:hypothetical protein
LETYCTTSAKQKLSRPIKVLNCKIKNFDGNKQTHGAFGFQWFFAIYKREIEMKLTKIFGSVVATFFVAEGGVSLSEVARIQAESKQLNDGFWTKIQNAVNGVFQRVVQVIGGGSSGDPREIDTVKITVGEIGDYAGVAERNAHTAVLMHAVKLWKSLQAKLQNMDLHEHVVDSLPEAPVAPLRPTVGTVCRTEEFVELQNIDEMIANLKSEVLARFDFAFWKKANELNSRAAAIGKLLSEQGAFFRRLVSVTPAGETQTVQTGVVITSWKYAYSGTEANGLVELREKLQAEYNDLQRQLNGHRKQVKDAVREYNLEQERAYQLVFGTYQIAAKAHNLEMERVRSAAETLRQEALQELASLRVRTE